MHKILNKNKIYFIAEAGVNHDGNFHKARKLVIAAKRAGADAVKFQSFKTEEFLSDKKLIYRYKKKKFNAFKMFKKLEFNYKWYHKLKKLCKRHNIEFLSSVADPVSAKQYLKYNNKILKLASEDIINYPLIKFLSKFKNKIIIVSTGMASLIEIKEAVKILTKKNKVILMHCVSLYPTKLSEINLKRLINLKKRFNLEVGFSDHTIGSHSMLIARSLGCRIFEKHFTLNKKFSGPDHFLSMDENDTTEAIKALKSYNEIIGDGYINPRGRELNSKFKFRRSIVAIKNIKKGAQITEDMIGLKRPSQGMHPKLIKKIIGKKAKKNFKINENISI